MGGFGRSHFAEVLVFAGAVLYLAWGIAAVPLASGFTDPIQKVRPQDEALYSSISIGMAERGEWLTPRFLGRLAFVKPILAFLPTAVFVRLFGDSLWSLRLFAVLSGAGAITLLWRWQGPSAALLLAANPLFFLLARRNMTDIPLLCAILASIYFWTRSPRAAGVALAWGILTKSVAGLAPAMFLFRGWSRVLFTAALLTAPWHLYQLAANGDWYWKEHVLDEHLQWGLNTPENAAPEPHAAFYASRAWAVDPVLAGLAPLALAVCLYRKRYVEAAWLGVSILVLFGFGYRNATYLVPVFAATAAAVGPHLHWGAPALLLAFRLFTATISHAPPAPVPPAPALEQYRSLHRPNGLILDGVEDEFVATTMHLPRVQYLLPGDARTLASTNIDFVGRGIITNAPSFQNMPEPAETVLLIRSTADLQHLLSAAADRDFLMRSERMASLQLGTRRVLAAPDGWVILLGVSIPRDGIR